MTARKKQLLDYNLKRDFSVTGEPQGDVAPQRQKDLVFMVQMHAARRLHYDLRLEWKGVLLSWAVTRGPSDDPREKRLAIPTEDHPLSYKDFEGNIPQGEYGGGAVMLWDQGTWQPLDNPDNALAEGKLRFNIQAQRMQGNWVLVRMGGKKNTKRESWLLIKERDKDATEEPDNLTDTYTTSVVSNRTMDEIRNNTASDKNTQRKTSKIKQTTEKTTGERIVAPRVKIVKNSAHIKRLPNPAFQAPQLATLVDVAPSSEKWLHETKFDGYRCLASVGSGGVKLFTRSGKIWNDKFANLVPAIEALPCRSALLDGEVMARHSDSSESAFSALQNALKNSGELVYYAFDLLVLDGEDLTPLPLLERKEKLDLLLKQIDTKSAVRFSGHVLADSQKVFEKVCQTGGEGIISKRIDLGYQSQRTKTWLKTKCTRRQEFVVGGYSPSSKQGRPFASLLVGSYEQGDFFYRGRVGTGFNQQEMGKLKQLFSSLERKKSPFVKVPNTVKKSAHWLSPSIVIEVDFAEFTTEGYVRHGAYLGRREDKMAKHVHLEDSTVVDEIHRSIAGVDISNGEREIFPKSGVTKYELARYYEEVGPRIIQLAGNRPFSLVRCPKGIGETCFYQKHAGKGFSDKLRSVDIEERSGKTQPYLYIESVEGMVAAAQMGTIEFHIWGSKVDALEKPDRLVFDLDPDLNVDFSEVKDAAFSVRDRLKALGLASIPLVTGGKGIHVCVLLRRTISWDTLKTFAKMVATIMVDAEPTKYTATMSKAKRKNKIFIDWLRNERGATAIVPYSVRARSGTPIATPVSWKELKSLSGANVFSIADVTKRLKKPCPYIEASKNLQTLGKSTLKKIETMLNENSRQ